MGKKGVNKYTEAQQDEEEIEDDFMPISDDGFEEEDLLQHSKLKTTERESYQSADSNLKGEFSQLSLLKKGGEEIDLRKGVSVEKRAMFTEYSHKVEVEVIQH